MLHAAVEPPEGGCLWVNTVPVTNAAVAPWTGAYFRNHPLPLRAEPSSGYQFAGWEGILGVTTNRLLLRLAAETRITARFEALPASLQLRVVAVQDALRIEGHGPANTAGLLDQGTSLVNWLEPAPVTFDATGRMVTNLPLPRTPIFFRLRPGVAASTASP